MLDTDATVEVSSHVLTDFSTTEQAEVTIENSFDVESKQHSNNCFVSLFVCLRTCAHISLGVMFRADWNIHMAQIFGSVRSVDLVKDKEGNYTSRSASKTGKCELAASIANFNET